MGNIRKQHPGHKIYPYLLRDKIIREVNQIFNSDQGSQFTSIDFIEKLKQRRIRISMDGRGKLADNGFTERL